MSLRSCWQSVVDFWTVPIRAESLAAFRIALGLTILAAQITGIGVNLLEYTGPDGICPQAAHDDWLRRSGAISLLRGPINLPLLGDWLPVDLAEKYPGLSNWVPRPWARAWADWGTKPTSIRMVYGIYMAALVALTLGFATRLATFVSLLLAATFNNVLAEFMNGGDSLFRNGLYFLLFSPAGAVWSVDRYLRTRRAAERSAEPVFIPSWPVRLMQIQIVVMYFFTGLCKLSDLRWEGGWLQGDWLDGTALYWVMNDVAVTRWSYAQMPVPMFVCRLLTWTTLVFELGFGLFLLFRRLRPWVLLFGVALHLGILATMEIGWFSQVTLCWYLLWVPGQRLASLFTRRPLMQVQTEGSASV